jgi:hypothetical protein
MKVSLAYNERNIPSPVRLEIEDGEYAEWILLPAFTGASRWARVKQSVAHAKVRASWNLKDRFAAEDAYEKATQRRIYYDAIHEKSRGWAKISSPETVVFEGEEAQIAYEALMFGIKMLAGHGGKDVDYLLGLIVYDRALLGTPERPN